MKRKPQKDGRSLVDELNEPLRNFVADFKLHGSDALEAVRKESPSKYLELATKLLPLVAALNPGANDLADCKDMNEIGIRLLKSVGIDEFAITNEMIAEAVAANDAFIAELEAIRDGAQGELS